MCKKAMVDFFNYVDTAGQEERVSHMSIDELCTFAGRLGFDFSLNELKEVMSAVKAHLDGRLNDDAFISISGGSKPNHGSPFFATVAAQM